MTISRTIKKVEPDRTYTLRSISKERLFPWAKDRRTIVKIVKKDYWGSNMLRAEISGEGLNAEYAIKGRNIIKFLRKYGPGLMLGPFQT